MDKLIKQWKAIDYSTRDIWKTGRQLKIRLSPHTTHQYSFQMVLKCKYLKIHSQKKKIYVNIYLVVQSSANNGLQAKSAMPINLYIVYGYFYTTIPKLSNCNGDHARPGRDLQGQQYLLSGLLQKKFANPQFTLLMWIF